VAFGLAEQVAKKTYAREASTTKNTAGAKQAAEKVLFPKEKCEKHASGPEGHIHFMPLIPGINPRPTARRSFSAAFKALVSFVAFAARLKSCPDTYSGSDGVFPQAAKPCLDMTVLGFVFAGSQVYCRGGRPRIRIACDYAISNS
jgi:hypothetical protein